MSTRNAALPRRAAAALAAGALAILAACAVPPAVADEPTPGPDTPVAGTPGADLPPVGDGALHVDPDPAVIDARPHAWEHISVSADGRELTVYWYGGVEDCYGLSEVLVETTDAGLSVTVMEGVRPAAEGQACIQIGVLKATTVTLDEPLIGNPALQP